MDGTCHVCHDEGAWQTHRLKEVSSEPPWGCLLAPPGRQMNGHKREGESDNGGEERRERVMVVGEGRC